MKDFFPQNPMVKVRGWNLNGKTVKQTVKNGRIISGDDAAWPAWVTGARRQQFAAASRFWSIPNLMPRSTVTRVWLTEWAHLGQLCGTLTSDNLFFFFFLSFCECCLTRQWQNTECDTRYMVQRKKFDVILRDTWLIVIGERSHPNPMHRSSLFQRDFQTGNRFGWSFFFAVWRRCARSQLHMNSVVLVESQGSCALVRIVLLQKFDRRDNMIFTVHLNRLIDENTPLEQSTIETCLQEAYKYQKVTKISCDIGSRFEASWLDCVTMMSDMTIAVIVVSASCHHLTRADSGWSRISWFIRVTLPWLRGGTSVAPWRHKCSHVPVSAVCLTVFPFEFRPRTFTIGFYGKNSIISQLMILECSFPLRVHSVERFQKPSSLYVLDSVLQIKWIVPLVWHCALLQLWHVQLKRHIQINKWIVVMGVIAPLGRRPRGSTGD